MDKQSIEKSLDFPPACTSCGSDREPVMCRLCCRVPTKLCCGTVEMRHPLHVTRFDSEMTWLCRYNSHAQDQGCDSSYYCCFSFLVFFFFFLLLLLLLLALLLLLLLLLLLSSCGICKSPWAVYAELFSSKGFVFGQLDFPKWPCDSQIFRMESFPDGAVFTNRCRFWVMPQLSSKLFV